MIAAHSARGGTRHYPDGTTVRVNQNTAALNRMVPVTRVRTAALIVLSYLLALSGVPETGTGFHLLRPGGIWKFGVAAS